jgi:hypothetical protein
MDSSMLARIEPKLQVRSLHMSTSSALIDASDRSSPTSTLLWISHLAKAWPSLADRCSMSVWMFLMENAVVKVRVRTCLSVHLSASLYLHLSLHLCASLCVSLHFSVCLFAFLCVSLCISLCVSLHFSVHVCVSLCISRCISVCLLGVAAVHNTRQILVYCMGKYE